MIEFRVSDLRQSRRLDGGGAAQSRMALRAVVPRSPCSQASWAFVRPLPIFNPSHAATTEPFIKPQGHRSASALQGRSLVALILQEAKLPPPRPKDIPGTVKLWESPRQSRGLEFGRFLLD